MFDLVVGPFIDIKLLKFGPIWIVTFKKLGKNNTLVPIICFLRFHLNKTGKHFLKLEMCPRDTDAPPYCQIRINRELSLTKGNKS